MNRSILVVFILLAFVPSCFGWGGSEGPTTSSRWKTYTKKNETGAEIRESVSTSIIIPNVSVILGYEIYSEAGNSENTVVLFDGAAGNYQTDELIGEAECEEDSFAGVWYPRPRIIEKQLCFYQGANTTVIIYFE